MDIRQFAEADEAAVIELWRDCGLLAPQNNPQRDIARKLQVGRELFLVGEIDGQIVASVMGGYEGHRGWVNYLAVSNEHRRKGYGVVLMRQIEALLLERGCPKLNLQVRRTNEAVLAFYHAMGYGEDEVVSLGKRLIPDKSAE
ncbi:N-acetyltransferase [Halioglobus japonicus]|uniref:GNAT family acetyltransferase n=1 Tax=Halioglobus japonicus TaxID=930805 RepID=A0AAP8SMQ2_9GAMM|nr:MULTISPECIES: GNAT family acetyltransferase [Halioglobus]AQA17868.1 N-acetyltransferase [Halioglobus japonicus]KZX56929.1 acetyltransferase GCN5 [Halioglobus sp. HI00S01]PLW85830.1 GNAT family acetyltransferase [Halioglobus japonicus]GHD17728.1 GNAT family acetyltransferase [Halioglobus japonicus]